MKVRLNDDSTLPPSVEEFALAINNPVFEKFLNHMKTCYQSQCKIEFSKDVYFKGWNMKFKKAGRSLCVVYPKENYFIVLVVVGRKEKMKVEQLLPSFHKETQDIYKMTKEGNGQRWLMIPIENEDVIFRDVLSLIRIRRECKKQA